jgi:hypothetical protein
LAVSKKHDKKTKKDADFPCQPQSRAHDLPMQNQQKLLLDPTPPALPARREPIHPTFAADRWLMASMLQKAIRREDAVSILHAFRALAKTDPTYLRKRLGVVAVEDIGIGAPAFLQVFMAQHYTFSADPNSFFIHLLPLRESPKSRLLCDLFYITASHPLMKEKDGYWSREAVAERFPYFSNFPLIERARMCQRLTQVQLAKLLPTCRGFDEAALNSLLTLLHQAKLMGVEQMDKMFPAVWGMQPVREVTTELPTPTYYGGVPDYAIDQHTRLGLQAIRQLMNQYHPIGWPSHGGQLAIIKNLLFILDSGLLHREAQFEGHDEVQRLVLEACVEHPSNFHNIERWLDALRELLPTLHKLREDIITSQNIQLSALKQSIKEVL